MTDYKLQTAALAALLARDPSPVGRFKALAEEARELSEAAQMYSANIANEKRRAHCFEEIIDVLITANLALMSVGVNEREWAIYGGDYAGYKIARQIDRRDRDIEDRRGTGEQPKDDLE